MTAFRTQNKKRQKKAPLFMAAKKYREKGLLSFHVPLHGRGPGAPELLRNGFRPLMRWDFTELPPLDDLHLPQGAIKEAQELAAELCKAEQTFFLVNGVTGGILALFLAFCRPGDKVLLSRISHKAALHGAALAGALPVFLPVEKDRASGFPLNVSAETVERALREHPDARLLFITSPSYWGIIADLQAIKKIAAKYDVIFAVDEAHGSHLSFYRENLPHSAAAGADLWLQSAHKSLGALTPGAFFHLGNKKFAPDLQFWLQALQTSSPSYPLMISLDLIRRQMALQGRRLFSASWKWAEQLREGLKRKGFKLLSLDGPEHREFNLDLCRVTILCQRGEGCCLAERMARKYHIQVEMYAHHFILAVVGPAQLFFAPDLFVRAASMARRERFFIGSAQGCCAYFSPSFFAQENTISKQREKQQYFPSLRLTPREALHAPSFSVALEDSPGKVCAEMVVLSPPGIPILSPGEVIGEEVAAFLLNKRATKVFFSGVSDPTLETIKVVEGTASC